MDDLRKYRIDFRVTFHCIGKKGLFHKKEYSFDHVLERDLLRTVVYLNARTTSRALSKAKALVKKQADYLVQQINDLKDGNFLIITGNTPPNGKFQWSSKVYGITGVDINLIKITDCGAWKDQNIKYAMENLSVEEFKTVFGETIPKQEDN